MRICTNHPQETIKNVCIANHQCKRFLCQKCFNSHGVGDLNKLKIEDFNKIIQNQFEVFKQQARSQQKERQKNEIKEFIKETKNKLARIEKEISQQIEMIDKEEQYYFDLITSNSPIVNYLDQNINSLIEIIRKKLENWILYKNGLKTTQKKTQLKGLKRYCAKLQETQFSAMYTKNMEMNYVQDGEILRFDAIEDYNNKPQIMKNLQQIKHLNWHGSFNLNYKKQGMWYPTWKGVKLDAGGSYSNGLKQENWKELVQNYWEKAEVFQQGNYQNNQKNAVWQIIRNNKPIHESTYSENGIKIGRGFELHDNYHEYFFIYLKQRELSYFKWRIQTGEKNWQNGILCQRKKNYAVECTMIKEQSVVNGKNCIIIF
ncbi:unnamed protein product [Paramecium octaurelia]|uniref:Uncharacterized protein n=1 Tax=Paramecium octaurelia TaxID=43137 RepID=A0A8S1Y9Y8_PAROT|nr:unnamed protein product [Paramecium octaurelia]